MQCSQAAPGGQQRQAAGRQGRHSAAASDGRVPQGGPWARRHCGGRPTANHGMRRQRGSGGGPTGHEHARLHGGGEAVQQVVLLARQRCLHVQPPRQQHRQYTRQSGACRGKQRARPPGTWAGCVHVASALPARSGPPPALPGAPATKCMLQRTPHGAAKKWSRKKSQGAAR